MRQLFLKGKTLLLYYGLALFLLMSGCSTQRDQRQAAADKLYTEALQLFNAQHYQQAEPSLRQALELDKDLKRYTKVANEYLYLGMIEERRVRYPQAIENYQQSLTNFRSSGDHTGEIEILNNIAQIHLLLGNPLNAIEKYNEALTISKLFHVKESEGLEYNNLGSAYNQLGKHDKALEFFLNAYQLNRALNDSLAFIVTLTNIGKAYSLQRQFQEALEYYLQAYQISTRGSHFLPSIELLTATGDAYRALKRFDQASRFYSEGLREARRHGGEKNDELVSLLHLGDLFYLQTKYLEAEKNYREALNIAKVVGNQITEAFLLVRLGDCERELSRYANASPLYRQAAELFSRFDLAPGLTSVNVRMGKVAEMQGKISQAVEYYKKSIEIREKALYPVLQENPVDESLALPASEIDNYTAIIKVLLAERKYDEAFWFTERSKAQTLVEIFRDLDVEPSNSELKSKVTALQSLQKEIVGLEGEHLRTLTDPLAIRDSVKLGALASVIASRKGEWFQLLDALKTQKPEYEFLFHAKTTRVQDIQQHLSANTVLLEYVPFETTTYIFVLTRELFTVKTVFIKKTLLKEKSDELLALLYPETLVPSEFSEEIKISPELRKVSLWLYGIFLKPMESYFINASNLLIVPPQEFYDLPFHALMKEGRGRTASYVIEFVNVNYLPLANALTMKTTSEEAIFEISAFGNVSGTDWDAEYQVRDIRGFYKGAKIHLALETTLDSLFSATGDLLHLTTEFLYNARHPGNSFFSLSEGKASGGLIRVLMGNLLALQNFSSVVLINKGSSVESLNLIQPTLLLLHGCTSVLVNFWWEEKRASRLFFSTWYEQLSMRAQPKAAFHQAQLTLLTTPEFAHPRYWAPYVFFTIN